MRHFLTIAVCWTSSAVLVWTLTGLHDRDPRAKIIAAVTLAVLAAHNFLYPFRDEPDHRRCRCNQ